MRTTSITKRSLAGVFAVLCLVGVGWLWMRQHARLASCRHAQQFAASVESADVEAIERDLLPSALLQEKAVQERRQLTLELLRNEISPEGMAILSKDGRFGPLHDVFPAEADAWAKAFSVMVKDCVAFRLQRGNATAELVLHVQPDSTYRILRVNDIRQLARKPTQP